MPRGYEPQANQRVDEPDVQTPGPSESVTTVAELSAGEHDRY